MKTNPDSDEHEVLRLPLWKNALDEMRQQQITYGMSWTAEWFENQLKCNRDDMKFGLGISEIRRELEKDGFYLSGRGQKGAQFVILMPESNASVMSAYQRAAVDALKRGVILGTNTRLDSLSDADRRKHESLLQRMATKCVLMQRSAKIAEVLENTAPKLLRQGVRHDRRNA